MHRTEGTNHNSNLFTNGPPATCIEQNWLNAVQEEIAYIIEQAGLTLKTASTDTKTQLYEAITKIKSGTFVTNSNGKPNISDTYLAILGISLAAFTWASVGPTGSGATNIWAALDNVPVGADWIKIRNYIQGSITAGSDANYYLKLKARKNGLTPTGGNESDICVAGKHALTGLYIQPLGFSEVTIPISSSRMFDLYYATNLIAGTVSISVTLVGYGYN